MFKRISAIFMTVVAAAVMLTGMAYSYDQVDYSGRNIVRVGISYGSSAVTAANAYAQYGYDIGYYNDNNVFVSNAYISNTFISAAKDATVYVDGSTVKDTPSSSATRFGAYHLQLEPSFSSYNDAKNYADSIDAKLLSAGYDIEVFPASYNEIYYVRIEHYSTLEYAKNDIDKFSSVLGVSLTAVGASDRAVTFIDMNSPHIICEFEYSNRWVAVTPHQNGSTVTYIRNGSYNYAGGFEYRRSSGANITFINVVDLKNYIMGVLPYEMSGSYPLEALRAQAICARCYYLGSYNKHSSYGFNVCASTDCQVYRGVGSVNERITQAVESTEGMILVYGNTLVTTYFYSSNGGSSEDNSNVWGGTQYPYYKAVPDDMEELTTANYGKWSSTVSKKDMNSLAAKYGLSDINDIYVSKYTDAGNVYEVTLVDSNGKTYAISQCDRVRTALSAYVKSARFTISTNSKLYINDTSVSKSIHSMYVIDKSGTAKEIGSGGNTYVITSDGKHVMPTADTFVFTGTGWGHSVGMSQLGARGRANAGWTGERIVEYYFTDTQVVRNTTLKG